MRSSGFNYGYICVMLLLLFDCRCWCWSDADCPTGFKFATANSGTKFSTNGVQKGWAARGRFGRWVLTPFTHFVGSKGKIKCGEAMSKVGDSGTKICCYTRSSTVNGFDSLSPWVSANPATMIYRYTYRRGNTNDGYTYTVLQNPKNVVRCQAGSDEGGVFPERGFAKALSCQRTNREVIPSSLQNRNSWSTCGNGGGRCTNIARSDQIQWFRYGNANGGRWVYGAILIEPSVASGKNWVYCGRQTLGGFNPNQDASNVCQIGTVTTTTQPPEPESEYQRIARKFAPIIHLFPKDTNRPSSVEDFFEIVNLKSKSDDSIIATQVTGDILGDEQYSGDNYYLDFKEAAPTGTDVYMTGNVADADGFVDAPLYCHITDESTTVYRITYALFYPFNGFQAFRVNYKTPYGSLSDHTRNVEWARFARHIGDWENVHIFVSKDTEEIVKVQASQHGDEELGYPSEIEIIGTRTVLYSAWNSHAFYYKQKTKTIEDLGSQGLLQTFKDINWIKVVDTTASGQEIDRYMLATDYNSNGVQVDVIRDDNLVVITDENESDFPWLYFDGPWGPPEMDNSHIDYPAKMEGDMHEQLRSILEWWVKESSYEKYLTAGGPKGPKTRNWWPRASVTHDGCPSGYILGTDDNGSKFSPSPINEGWIARGANGRWILTPFTHFMQSTGKVACGESLSKPGDDVDKICCVSYENTQNGYGPRDWTQTNKVTESMGLTRYEYRRGSAQEGFTYTVVENPVNVPQCNAGSDKAGVFPHRGFAISDSMICEVTEEGQLPSNLLSVTDASWIQCGTAASGRCEDIPKSDISRWFRFGSAGHWVYSKILIDNTVAAGNNWLHCSRKTLGGYNPHQNGNNVCEYARLDGESASSSAAAAADLDRVSDLTDHDINGDNNNNKAASKINTALAVMMVLCLFCCVFGMCIMYLYQKRKRILSGYRRTLQADADNDDTDIDNGKQETYLATAHATDDKDVDEGDINV